jgi:hypothetical protein
MPLTAPAQFLNLDLVLKSNSDLSVIIQYFADEAFVLSHHQHGGEWTLVLELAEEELTQDPNVCTQRLLAIISGFPDDVRDVWEACTSRTFSYGFDGGCNSPALDTTISTDLLRQLARVGADIGMTVYPFRRP